MDERLSELLLEAADDGPAAELRGEVLVLRPGTPGLMGIEQRFLLRRSLLFLKRGDLQLTLTERRSRGSSKGPFLCQGDPVLQAVGRGLLLLHPGAGRRFELVGLRGEVLYLREDTLAAFSSLLRWENGRIPGAGPGGPEMIQLHGNGCVALRCAGPLHTFAAEQGTTIEVSLECVVGWSSELVPQVLEDRGEPAGGLAPDGMRLSFSGHGLLLLSPPRPSSPRTKED